MLNSGGGGFLEHNDSSEDRPELQCQVFDLMESLQSGLWRGGLIVPVLKPEGNAVFFS